MEIKDRIVQGSEELFFKYGVKTVTMDDVAKHLGISKKTIYQFFEDKDELVLIVTSNHCANNLELLIAIEKSSIDPIDEFLKISEHVRTTMQNINASVLFDVQKFHSKAYEKFVAHKDHCIKMLKNNMTKGIGLGLYRENLNVDILSKLRMAEVEWAFNPFVFPSLKYKLQEVQLQFIDHFLHGICTIKGHKLINKYKQINEDD